MLSFCAFVISIFVGIVNAQQIDFQPVDLIIKVNNEVVASVGTVQLSRIERLPISVKVLNTDGTLEDVTQDPLTQYETSADLDIDDQKNLGVSSGPRHSAPTRGYVDIWYGIDLGSNSLGERVGRFVLLVQIVD